MRQDANIKAFDAAPKDFLEAQQKSWVVDALFELGKSIRPMKIGLHVLVIDQPSRAVFAIDEFPNAGDFIVYPVTNNVVVKDPSVTYQPKVADAYVDGGLDFVLSPPSGKLESLFFLFRIVDDEKEANLKFEETVMLHIPSMCTDEEPKSRIQISGSSTSLT